MERNIQLLCIKARNFFLRKKEAERQKNILSYTAVKQIGVLFRARNKEEAKAIDVLIQGFLNDAKSVSAFTFLNDEASPECKVPFKAFRPSDFDRWGRIKLEVLNRFLETPLDYLLCLTSEDIPEFEHLLLRSPAHCRMGTDQTNQTDLFEIVYNTKSVDPVIAAEAILSYMRKLQGTWVKPVYLADRL